MPFLLERRDASGTLHSQFLAVVVHLGDQRMDNICFLEPDLALANVVVVRDEAVVVATTPGLIDHLSQQTALKGFGSQRVVYQSSKRRRVLHGNRNHLVLLVTEPSASKAHGNGAHRDL